MIRIRTECMRGWFMGWCEHGVADENQRHLCPGSSFYELNYVDQVGILFERGIGSEKAQGFVQSLRD